MRLRLKPRCTYLKRSWPIYAGLYLHVYIYLSIIISTGMYILFAKTEHDVLTRFNHFPHIHIHVRLQTSLQ